MGERVELPMNKDPYIHSNISRTSLFAVLTSDAYAGKVNAVLSRLILMADGRNYDGFRDGFDNCLEHMQMDIDPSGSAMTFQSHPYIVSKYAYLYQSVDTNKDFCIEATIKYIQESNACSCVGLVLSKGRKGLNEDTQRGVREYESINGWLLRLNANGSLCLQADAAEKDMLLAKTDRSMPITIRIKKDSLLTIQYSYDRMHWIEVYKADVDLEGINEVGVCISPKVNPFFYDFYISHIQLCYTSDNMIIAPHFDYYERYFSKMLPAMQVPMGMIGISDEKVVNYFTGLIAQGYYINMGVDEFYIPGRDDYGKRHHMHVNFLYGFDKAKGVFQLIGFDRFLKFSEITFENFFLGIQREVSKGTKINVYKYNSRSYPDAFNLEAAVYCLKAYVRGHHSFAISASEIIVEDKNRPIVYGLDIHEMICSDEQHMSRFLRDIRVVYQIYEHNLIMKEMLGFMNHIQVLADEDYNKLEHIFDNAVKLSAVLKNVVLKNRMASKKNIEVKVKDMLMDLREKEKENIEKLIVSLEHQPGRE